jgi:diguanylate cyclase
VQRYTESKPRSAELLRTALAHMGQHAAAFNPLTYTVWYEYAAGINPRLTRALEDALATDPELGDDSVRRLFQAYVADADEAAVREISDELQRVMTGVAASASRTGEQAGAFSVQIDGLASALQAEASELTPIVTQVSAGAASMKSSAQALQQQVLTSTEEITRLRADLSRARAEALLDSLTQVLNRKGFDQRLQAMLTQPPGPGLTHGLILLDIDHFKAVNDQHGHVMGDRVLQAVGAILRRCVGEPEQTCARYGGEEFSILLPASTREAAVRMAETVRAMTKGMKLRDRRTQDVVLTITISAGIAMLHPGEDAPGLVARADDALYRSKQAGRDRVTVAGSR